MRHFLHSFFILTFLFSLVLQPSFSPAGDSVWPSVFEGIHKDSARMIGGPPRDGLLLYARGGVSDTIGLSVSDYDDVETYWQGVFYTNPTTPLQVAVSTIQADGNVNTTTVWSTTKGTAVYGADTADSTLIKVARWFGFTLDTYWNTARTDLWDTARTDLWNTARGDLI